MAEELVRQAEELERIGGVGRQSREFFGGGQGFVAGREVNAQQGLEGEGFEAEFARVGAGRRRGVVVDGATVEAGALGQGGTAQEEGGTQFGGGHETLVVHEVERGAPCISHALGIDGAPGQGRGGIGREGLGRTGHGAVEQGHHGTVAPAAARQGLGGEEVGAERGLGAAIDALEGAQGFGVAVGTVEQDAAQEPDGGAGRETVGAVEGAKGDGERPRGGETEGIGAVAGVEDEGGTRFAGLAALGG